MRKKQLFILGLLILLMADISLATESYKPKVTSAGEKPGFRYPVNWAPAGEVESRIESVQMADGTNVATIIGRVYVWQRQNEQGGLLEFQADNAVMFLADRKKVKSEKEKVKEGELNAIYMSGDVVLTEGQRTIRADEIYYDFQRKKAIVINAVMKSFDTSRDIPIYVRAAKLRQLAENKFAAKDITLTSSEFYQPQISLTASDIIITDTTTIDAQLKQVSDSGFDARMHDVRLKLGDKTIFYWPFMRNNMQRPDVPFKSVNIGHDNTWGTSIETRWHLSRLLGLREPEGTDGTFSLDYYGKRGPASGVEIDYERENYFGRLLGYIIKDTGQDRLGRASGRKGLEPPRELRGRFHFQHRQFLPYNWQLTAEVSYASDKNFIESFYRGEFYVGKEQETLIHLKRIEDNWGLSILNKVRINGFVEKKEELPSIEFHLTGQSFLDDKLTLYSDSQVSRFRQRFASDSALRSQRFFTFMSERAEVDMPMTVGRTKVVGFVAGTLGYEDRLGFRTNIDGSTVAKEDEVWLGEVGVRVFPQSYWKVHPDVKSRLWDLKGLRHIVRPQLTAVVYDQSDPVVEQRDTLNFGISQRLQTKRPAATHRQPRQRRVSTGGEGIGDEQQTVDWMRLDMDATWVNNSADASAGADRFIWNKPFIPMQDRPGSNIFGPRRNYFGADYTWHISNTSAVLSDMNYDMQSGVVQQFNIGFSRLCWPDLSYYIGSRYLRRIEVLGEKGSNAFTFAATYVLDPRYTLVYSGQFDFDYGANIRSDITLIRRYHRMYCALTFSADDSLDRQSIVFSIWPQGVPELAAGPRRYMEIGSYGQ